MGLREKVQALPRGVVYGIAGACVLVAAVSLAWWVWPGETEGLSDRAVLMCAEKGCGRVESFSNREILERRTLDETHPLTPGMPCAGCGKNSMALALTCPKCQKVYVKRVVDKGVANHAGVALCPGCGWDYVAAERERLARLMGK